MAWKKEIEVKVLVNGCATQEYEDEDEEAQGPNTVTKFIEAVSGAEFEVQYEMKPSFQFPSQHLVLELSIDGKVLDNAVLSKREPAANTSVWRGSLRGLMRSHGVRWSLERFRFSDIKMSQFHCP